MSSSALGAQNSVLRCDACDMVFNTPSRLQSHKTKYCIGDGSKSKQQLPNIFQETYPIPILHPSKSKDNFKEWLYIKKAADQKLMQLREDRMKGLRKAKQMSEPSTPIENLWDRRATELDRLSRARRNSVSSKSTISINLPMDSSDEDPTPEPQDGPLSYKPSKRLQHEHQKARRTRYLETEKLRKQKTNLEQQIQLLEEKGDPADEWIQKLQENQRFNEKMLEDLRDKQTDRQNNNELMREVQQMRQSYLRRGGNDRKILEQMAIMESEALERIKKTDKGNAAIEAQTTALQEENKRLQEQLAALVNSNNKKLQYMDDDIDNKDWLRNEIERGQGKQKNQLEILQKQIDQLQYDLERERQKRREHTHIREFNNIPPKPVDLPIESHRYTSHNVPDLQPSLYDPNSGFTIFYDFISGLPSIVVQVRLLSALYLTQHLYSTPTTLPLIPAGFDRIANVALIAATQPVPNCKASTDLSLIVEVQVSEGGGGLVNRAWCKVLLFDSSQRLQSGRWKVPLRIVPVRQELASRDINYISQYGAAELYFRLVNHRDVENQMKRIVDTHESFSYNFMPPPSSPQWTAPSITIPPPPPSDPPPESPILEPQRSIRPFSHQYRANDYDIDNLSLGLQVIRLKYAEPGPTKIDFTAYNATTGKVLKTFTRPVQSSTTVQTDYYRYCMHIFGKEEMLFENLSLKKGCILVVRVYQSTRAVPEIRDTFEDFNAELYDLELIAWSSLPLTIPDTNEPNIGSHTLLLYQLPVANISNLPTDYHYAPKNWKRFGRAVLKLRIFVNKLEGESSDESDAYSEPEELPSTTWLLKQRMEPSMQPYEGEDGFDIYIDGCMNLPEVCTITRIAGRFLDSTYNKHCADINCLGQLDSDVWNPIYDHRMEVRVPNLPPTTTLLIKIYTIDKFTKEMTVVGFATLAMFVTSGSEMQPVANSGGYQISLNAGAHQRRIFLDGPKTEKFSQDCLNSGRIVPCSSILIRIVPAPKGPNNKTLQRSEVPEDHWQRVGLAESRPKYSQRVYLSESCSPTRGEALLFPGMVKRTKVSIRETARILLQEVGKQRLSDHELQNKLRKLFLNLMDTIPKTLDITYVSQYDPKIGLSFAVDAAMNIPWKNFTHVQFCLSPPGSYYKGLQEVNFDRPLFTENLDMAGSSNQPDWHDGLRHFPMRHYNRHLVMIIHLQEIYIRTLKDRYKYGLNEQAWTVLPIFTDKFCYTGAFQLPLFYGPPSLEALAQIAKQPYADWLKQSLDSESVKYLDRASVFVRICDGRRFEEVRERSTIQNLLNSSNGIQYVNTSFIPESSANDYLSTTLLPSGLPVGNVYSDLIPAELTSERCKENLAVNFQKLCYKIDIE
ncbi:DgyrCDS12050 [Dimorphilus gyrociliatus]|uniref:DgyrCDS12050 n=1 Tax=Dimorphilus gyrociliatus TaxID=2664684 RepID=A0A7I8W753_9ANNE|nr:DgyrCDS12050 [Dimorphilus gyrociliatus]